MPPSHLRLHTLEAKFIILSSDKGVDRSPSICQDSQVLGTIPSARNLSKTVDRKVSNSPPNPLQEALMTPSNSTTKRPLKIYLYYFFICMYLPVCDYTQPELLAAVAQLPL